MKFKVENPALNFVLMFCVWLDRFIVQIKKTIRMIAINFTQGLIRDSQESTYLLKDLVHKKRMDQVYLHTTKMVCLLLFLNQFRKQHCLTSITMHIFHGLINQYINTPFLSLFLSLLSPQMITLLSQTSVYNYFLAICILIDT